MARDFTTRARLEDALRRYLDDVARYLLATAGLDRPPPRPAADVESKVVRALAYGGRGFTVAELSRKLALDAHVLRAVLASLRRRGRVARERFGRETRYRHEWRIPAGALPLDEPLGIIPAPRTGVDAARLRAAREALARAVERFADELHEILQAAIAEALVPGPDGGERAIARPAARTARPRARRGRSPLGTTLLAEQVADLLAGAGGSLSMAELANLLELRDRRDLSMAVRALRRAGRVEKVGLQRGARYRLLSPDEWTEPLPDAAPPGSLPG